ncbi:phenylalanine--tRNA ligase alpha subunit-like [Panthera onca]
MIVVITTISSSFLFQLIEYLYLPSKGLAPGYKYKSREEDANACARRQPQPRTTGRARRQPQLRPPPPDPEKADRERQVLFPGLQNKTLGATHLAEFHQLEGIVAARDCTLGHLRAVMRQFFSKLGITKLCFKLSYRPCREPSTCFVWCSGIPEA